MTQNDKTSERGNFVQYPCQLIYNCPNLNRDDKWTLLSIMGVCWTEEFYKLSYRDVSKLSGIPLSLLSSITGKDGRPDKEGIMDRLKRLEYISCSMGKELNSATGKPRGNAQTYIKVNYTKIWAESVLYKITPYSPQKDFEPVSYTNRLTEKPNQPVSHTNAPVPHANTSVPNTNRPVSYTNAPVRDLSVNLPPYITYTNIDNLDKTDNVVLSGDENHASPKTLCYPFKQHPFIGVDDEYQPTVMIVTLTPAFPHPFFSEMEDKRRERIAAWEVLPAYKKQGLDVEIRWEHETERQTVDAVTTIVEQGDTNATTFRDIDASRYPADLRSSNNTRPHSVLEAHTKAELNSTVLDGGNSLQSFFTPTEECVCGVCQRVYKNKDLLASEGENAPCGHPKSMCFDVKDTPSDQDALESPTIDEKQPCVEPQGRVALSIQDKPSESQRSATESISSTQGVDESSNQATEQGEQANGDDPIATGATKKARGGRGKKAEQAPLIVLAPEMPPATARWNEETAVQIIEAKKGRRYSDTTRSQEKGEAKKVLAMYYGDLLITRELFEKAVDDMISWPFWKEHTNVKPMIKTLRKDDKIIAILDELEKKNKPVAKPSGNIRQFPQTAPQERPSVLVSEEARARNLARLRANAAAVAQAQAL